MSAADLLHPVLLHHIVNSLQWPGLRPLQEVAVEPLLAGEDALLLAPTAGGKTEAVAFPLLSRMTAESWSGTSVLYLCPLKALLNNLQPRLDRYAGWLGRKAALWHGDVTASRRQAILAARPDLLLTTPESLESMLVSQKVDHRAFFTGLQAVVVDEVHAFAGDDRGWHLLAVLERLTHLIGRPVQRVGLSATVGNPSRLLTWLQGSGAGTRPALDRLAQVREEESSLVHPGGSVVLRDHRGDDLRWWTWAGFRANATLAATLTEVVDPVQRFDDRHIRLRENVTRAEWRTLIADARERLCLPDVNKKALDGLKFSEALPERLAMATLAARLADLDGATVTLRQPVRFVEA